ncbi:hypothetical protein EX30DRAFT_357665 [Ascodesmis nigricans]|uniref:tRNA 4-demethylwyosine synthase (AdoMet-dependent) n=1 Tax=Ascodesmis nigricans TaxID=341454 RepID=A0A4S2N469_9PEZI|nr:hypothetical protein EX30DRAFT_357665 [Ascodesmis nigricans]
MASPNPPSSWTTLVLDAWHEHRIAIFVSALATVALFRLYSSLRRLLYQETKSIDSLSAKPKLDAPFLSAESEKNPAAKTAVSRLDPSEVDIERISRSVKQSAPNPSAGKAKAGPKRIAGKKPQISPSRRPGKQNGRVATDIHEGDFDVQVLIFYSSLTGSTAQYAKDLKESLFSATEGPYPKLSIETPSNGLPAAPISRNFLPAQLYNLEEIELDDYFISPPKAEEDVKGVKYIYLVVTPSYETDSPVAPFLEHLQETHHDFRIDTAPLRSLAGFSVFGFGDSSEWPSSEGKFCQDAINVDKWLGKLTGGRSGSRRLFPLGMGDMNPSGEGPGADESFKEWRIHLEEAMREYAETGSLGGSPESRTAVESGDEDSELEDEDAEAEDVVDLEDISGMIPKKTSRKDDSTGTVKPAPLPIDFTTPAGKLALAAGEGQAEHRKEMVPKDGVTYSALTKQGYTIVGSHSGVKICRWTKSALRGRGSCYKFSFYGIRSHLCMETTPSLSCSNKCVFCWRHGTNPVGTTWRWKVDAPDVIFRGVVEGHYRKIKMLKGVPGVRADRFAEAFRIRHCALSLVGEPIFYPYINEFLALLHGSKISSFLVCNAQHPAQLRALGPVTQLYVSIDASNRDSLKRIDRPLHRDFWERFQECMDIIREKRDVQRTVFRLTLVKGFNVEDEVQGYADLVERALPNFVEVKGVTYCGTSTAADAGLTMGNVPFYEEVADFVVRLDKELTRRGLEYGIAAEHAHSCCILIASKRFHVNGKWHTLIDYEKFFKLLEEGREFSPVEYIGEANPEWALFGNGGFNPEDERVYRKGKGPKAVAAGGACGAGEEESGGCG